MKDLEKSFFILCAPVILWSLHFTNTTPCVIQYTDSYLSRFMHRPNPALWRAEKDVLRYCKGTQLHGLMYRKGVLWIKAILVSPIGDIKYRSENQSADKHFSVTVDEYPEEANRCRWFSEESWDRTHCINGTWSGRQFGFKNRYRKFGIQQAVYERWLRRATWVYFSIWEWYHQWQKQAYWRHIWNSFGLGSIWGYSARLRPFSWNDCRHDDKDLPGYATSVLGSKSRHFWIIRTVLYKEISWNEVMDVVARLNTSCIEPWDYVMNSEWHEFNIFPIP